MQLVSVPAGGRVRRHWPRAPLTFDTARVLADEIHDTPGWRVDVVRGEAPAGPPRTSMRHASVLRGGLGAPARGRVRTAPVVVAIAPSGRRVTIGSRERWKALLDQADRDRDPTPPLASIAATIGEQTVCYGCWEIDVAAVDAPPLWPVERLGRRRCARCGLRLATPSESG